MKIQASLSAMLQLWLSSISSQYDATVKLSVFSCVTQICTFFILSSDTGHISVNGCQIIQRFTAHSIASNVKDRRNERQAKHFEKTYVNIRSIISKKCRAFKVVRYRSVAEEGQRETTRLS